MRCLFLSVLMLIGVSAEAMPVDFSNVIYSVSTFAELGDDSDGINADDSPPSSLPLLSHAEVVGTDSSVHEFATADAVADDLFLSVASEVQGNLRHAGAVAEASFAAELSTPGAYVLRLDLDNLRSLSGGTADAVLGLSLSVDSSTLFDEVFSHSGTILRSFALAPGAHAVMNISLQGSADGFGDGAGVDLYGFNLASVNLAVRAVPTPSPLALMTVVLLPMLGRRCLRSA